MYRAFLIIQEKVAICISSIQAARNGTGRVRDYLRLRGKPSLGKLARTLTLRAKASIATPPTQETAEMVATSPTVIHVFRMHVLFLNMLFWEIRSILTYSRLTLVFSSISFCVMLTLLNGNQYTVLAFETANILQTIYRKDYTSTPYLIPEVCLDFQLEEASTIVKSRLQVKPNYKSSPPDMCLDGE